MERQTNAAKNAIILFPQYLLAKDQLIFVVIVKSNLTVTQICFFKSLTFYKEKTIWYKKN